MYLLRQLTGAGYWRGLVVSALLVLPLAFPQTAICQTKHPSGQNKGSSSTKSSGSTKAPSSSRPSPATAQNASLGDISGTVTDQDGAVAEGAQVELMRDNDTGKQQVLSGANGEYSFTNVTPGPFRLTVTAPGFDTKIYSGDAKAGQTVVVPTIVLTITTVTAEVNVELTPVQVAEEQLHEEVHQRVFGIIPNFYVTYEPDPAPLIARQKFKLAFRSVTDPITVAGAAFLAGIYQAADEFPGYGQGAQGYGKRFGAAYADVVVGTFVGSAAVPSLLHQDPRYFYQGTGSTGSRLKHALANAIICRGDNKKWQPNYSNFIGAFASGGVSYLYYPAADRSLSLVVQNSLVRIAESSVAGLVQEFVVRRWTSVRGAKKQNSSTQP